MLERFNDYLLLCWNPLMITCSHALIFTYLISTHICTHLDDEMSIGLKAKVIVYLTFVRSNALRNVLECWGDWVLNWSHAYMIAWSHACMFTCFVDNQPTYLLVLMITCSHVHLLWWSHAPIFTCFYVHVLCWQPIHICHCFDDNILTFYLLSWSHASIFTCFFVACFNDLMLLSQPALMITCPLACMPSC